MALNFPCKTTSKYLLAALIKIWVYYASLALYDSNSKHLRLVSYYYPTQKNTESSWAEELFSMLRIHHSSLPHPSPTWTLQILQLREFSCKKKQSNTKHINPDAVT